MSGKLSDYEENSRIAAETVEAANTLTLKALQDRAYNQIYGELKKSIDHIAYLRDTAEEESIQLKAAQDLCDRGGLIATKSLNVTGPGFHFEITPDQLSNIEQAKKLMGDS